MSQRKRKMSPTAAAIEEEEKQYAIAGMTLEELDEKYYGSIWSTVIGTDVPLDTPIGLEIIHRRSCFPSSSSRCSIR